MELDRKSILEMSSGAILERTNYEVGKIIDNILDPNTKPDAKRKLTITQVFQPSADRKSINVQTIVKAALVPTEAITTQMVINSMPGTGEMVVVESTPQIPGQFDVDVYEQSGPKVLKFARQA